MVRRINDDLAHPALSPNHGQPANSTDPNIPTFRLADDQFNALVDLLKPGYELSKRYLAASDTQIPEGGEAGKVAEYGTTDSGDTTAQS